MSTSRPAIITLTVVFLFSYFLSSAQQITGVWKGKMKTGTIELKLIKSGDSLQGISYYYLSKNNYRSYSVKGYFEPTTNEIIWWEDVLLEQKGGRSAISLEALLQIADFNCPGEDKMFLDGTSSVRDNKNISKGPIHLEKIESSLFSDQWDWVIDHYTSGTNDPYVIDSIAMLVAGPRIFPEEVLPVPQPVEKTFPQSKKERPVVSPPITEENKTIPDKRETSNQEKFSSRKNKLQLVIPVTASTIELRFYDNATIDGDSIAIFLNGNLLREHILLAAEPQTIFINAGDLQEDNELVLVAENLGSIPPNTSYLVAIVGKKQYEARLFADEGSSALVRLIKQKEK